MQFTMHTPANRGGACRPGSVLLVLLVVVSLLGRSIAQGAAPPSAPPISLRIVDEHGQPLPSGTELVATVQVFPDPAEPARWIPSGIGPEPSRLVVGSEGTVQYTPIVRGIGGIEWLRLARGTVHGARALVPLRTLPDRIVLVPEQLLAAGTIVDQAGTAVPQWAPMLGVVGDDRSGVPAAQLLEPRWVNADGKYELWGWRAEGPFWVTAAYAYHGPSAPRTALVFGATDLTLTLPTTGHVQVKLATPKPFPERGAVFAVLRDLDRGGVQRHFLIPNDATNIRVLVGRFTVTLELNGVVVRDCGTLTVAHNGTTKVEHDLRPTVRVFRIEVVGSDGKPDLAARVRVAGSPDEPMGQQLVEYGDGRRYAAVVATTLERVDLEVSPSRGNRLVVVKGVDGDRSLELPAERP